MVLSEILYYMYISWNHLDSYQEYYNGRGIWLKNGNENPYYFHLIVFSWLLFRATNMDNCMNYINGLIKFETCTMLSPLLFVILSVAFLSTSPQKSVLKIQL
jgi:hypothetical protein